jgi:hypothetical protein
MNVDYVKYNTYRKDSFSLKTQIYTDVLGNKVVKKSPVTEQSRDFLEHIAGNSKILNLCYKNIAVCPCRLDSDGIYFNYISGDSYSSRLLDIIKTQDKKRFIDYLYLYKDILLDKNNIQTKRMTCISPEFEEVFGDFGLNEFEFETMPVSNIDLSFDNLIYQGDSLTIIDYEWVFTFEIPLKYIIYRNLNIFYAKFLHKIELQRFLSYEEALKLFDIFPHEGEAFREMEKHFQHYVHGIWNEVYEKYLKPTVNIAQLEEFYKNNQGHSDYACLYWKNDGSYSEDDSIKVKYSIPENCTIDNPFYFKLTLDVFDEYLAEEFRVDVSTKPCAFKLHSCYITNAVGKIIAEVELKHTNANLFFYDYYIFLHDDTQLIFEPLQFDKENEDFVSLKLILELYITNPCVFAEKWIHQNEAEVVKMNSIIDSQSDLIKQHELQLNSMTAEIASKSAELNNVLLDIENNKVVYENELRNKDSEMLNNKIAYETELDNLRRELENIYCSWSWRFLRAVRKIFLLK